MGILGTFRTPWRGQRQICKSRNLPDTHFTFLNAYLMSKGAAPANLDPFRTLPGGRFYTPAYGDATSTLDTSWWTRYRSSANNPDLDPNFVFPQAVPGLASGQFTAIPRTDADLSPPKHLQAIANTAAFHMPTIEQGGNSLYLRWHRERAARKCCESSSASVPRKPCTSKPGPTKRATPFRILRSSSPGPRVSEQDGPLAVCNALFGVQRATNAT